MTEPPIFRTPDSDANPGASPFVSIWFEPGPTIGRLAASNPMRLFYPLAAVWGASYNLSLVIRRGVPVEKLSEVGGNPVWIVLATNVGVGAIFGIVTLWLLAFLYAWIGRLLGGTVRAPEVRTVLAWSSVPHVLNLALGVVVLLFGGKGVLTSHQGDGLMSSIWPVLIFYLGTSVLGLWGFIISVAGMEAITGLTRMRALGVMLLGGVIIMTAIFGIVMLLVGLDPRVR